MRRLPPIPPPFTHPSPYYEDKEPKSQSTSVNNRRNITNLDNKLTNNIQPNHYSTLEPPTKDFATKKVIAFGLNPSKITLESHTESNLREEEGIKSCQMNVDRIVLEGTNLLEFKPELKKILFGSSNSESDCELIRAEFQKLMSTFNATVKDNPNNEKGNTLKKGNSDVKSIEAKVIIDEGNFQTDSSDNSGLETQRRKGTKNLSPPVKKNLSVRFQGPSPQPSKEERRHHERRRKRRSSRRNREKFEVRRTHDTSSTCSTCSSSSSSDEESIYQLPPRRAYGGVRLSYVPNDALAAARQRQQLQPQSKVQKKPAVDKNCTIS